MNENLQEDWLDARLRDEAAHMTTGVYAGVVSEMPAVHSARSPRLILLGVTLWRQPLPIYSRWGMVIVEEVTRFARLPTP